jgi:Uncharacterized conserved protein (DUF2190)
MANFNNVAESPVVGGDIPFKNNTLVDIPEGCGVLVDPSNDYGVALPTSGGGVAGSFGVSVEPIPAGKTGRIRFYGTIQMIANGSITRGGEVQISDTASKLGFAKAKGAGIAGIGLALCSASDGDPVLIALSHSFNA